MMLDFTPLVLGPLNRLVWWEVPLGYIALRSFLFLQEQLKDIIIIIPAEARTDLFEWAKVAFSVKLGNSGNFEQLWPARTAPPVTPRGSCPASSTLIVASTR
jgi:hypothetical protein